MIRYFDNAAHIQKKIEMISFMIDFISISHATKRPEMEIIQFQFRESDQSVQSRRKIEHGVKSKCSGQTQRRNNSNSASIANSLF